MLDGRVEFGAGSPDRLEADDSVWPQPVGVRHHPAKCPSRFRRRQRWRSGLDALLKLANVAVDDGAVAAKSLVADFSEELTGVSAALGEAFVEVWLVVIQQGPPLGDLDQQLVDIQVRAYRRTA
ncbi:hypothetical protein ACGFYU_02765 [Streptomyces sp. NPDC048337]|uniref:hypothetical protein n=1 Tax=Streptomyces sp. NPDC048337 TaxID=3365535 RepID=UPI00371AB63F